MAEEKKHKGLKIAGWVLGILLLLVVLLPFSLYIPWVQNIAKDYACEWASKKTGMDISVGRVLIKFPLDVSVDDVLALDQNGDTVLAAGNLTASVALKPLLEKCVEVDEAQLTDGQYRFEADDESLLLKARLKHCRVRGIDVDLKKNTVNVADGALRGGDVALEYLPYKVEQDNDTTASEPWRIKAGRLTLDDVNYSMKMLPTIDDMQAYVGHAELKNGQVDTGAHTVNASYLNADSVDCKYYYPSADSARRYEARHPVPMPSIKLPGDTVPWTVTADSVRLSRGHAIYAQKDAKPASKDAMDMNYLEVSDVNIAVDNLETRGSSVNASIASLSGRERSGLEIKQGSGNVSLDSTHVDLKQVKLKTMMSDISLDGDVDMALLKGDKNGNMHLTTDSKIALQEVGKVMPSLRPTLKDVPQVNPVSVKGDVSGTMRRLQINSLTADMPRYAHATVSGVVNNPLDPDNLSGEIALDGRFDNISWIKPTLMDKATQKQLNLPPMAIKGKAKLAGNTVSADATMTLATGKVVGKGTFNSKSMDYDVDAQFDHFPVRSVLPLSEVGDLTGHVQAKGHGLDILKPNAKVDANIDLASVGYNNAIYRNLKAKVKLDGGAFDGKLSSNSKNCDVNMDVTGRVNGNRYTFDAHGRINDLDLQALKMYKGTCAGNGNFAASGSIDTQAGEYDVDVNLSNLDWNLDGARLVADEAQATFKANNNLTVATLDNEDNHLRFEAPMGMDMLSKHFRQAADIAMDQYNKRSLNIDTLKQALPPFAMNVSMGRDGLVQRFLEERYELDFRDVRLNMRNDSNIFIDGWAHSISVGETTIDTLTLKASEWDKKLAFEAHMGNRRGTMDEWAQVTVKGGVKGSVLDFLLTQQNIDREMGYRLGCNATLTDTAVNMRLFPSQPIVGYRKWSVNNGNFVNYNYTNRMLDANLVLQSGESQLALTSKRLNGPENKENIFLDINNLRIEEWTNLVPSLKSMSGTMNADFDLVFDGKNMEGTGEAELLNFVYDGHREGDFKLTTDYVIDPATVSTRINADLLVDGSHVAVAYGALNDSTSTSPLNLAVNLDRFPLRKVSAFIPGNLIRLRGYANGELTMTGSMDNPVLNGYLVGDSAYVTLPRYGSRLQLAETRIPIKNNVIDFDNYQIKGLNDNSIALNGTVNLQSLDNPIINLRMKGRNVQFIGSEQRRFSQIFGKAFADLDASVISRNNVLNIRADATLLSGSNITYVLQDNVNTLTTATDEDMVTFVNFNDSTDTGAILKTASGKSLSTSILANIDVQQGAKISAYLSEDGKDRATVDGSGRLKYSLDFAGKDALNGTYTIESGNVRYSPPLISQKNFDINSGSTITWTGDMLNPQLNLTGTERLKTSVTSDDGARLVEFLITANVGGTLSNINLGFDLASENDMTVQNELQSMSNEQRSQAAINMLLYNTYSGTSSAGRISNLTASSALFSFLQSQLNNWAAKSLKGIDLTFGINQYEGTRRAGLQTSYSYRLAKSLFNDRFKIVVGGEYSTDATAEENFGQNLISDISFEYYLNEAGSKYLRLFRHTGFESVLEGQITETGVGFVMKRKVGSLADFFHRSRSVAQIATQDSIEALEKAARQAQIDAEEAIAAARAAADSTATELPPIILKDDETNDE
ncbi:MAG: translocation/assembly module TamB domain-containing protein [Muribaculaceae bacterium]|nr:translocation/assembly module TamB domain-containing protein [Muribaculaceae bacterium]